MTGYRITSLEELADVAYRRKSVVDSRGHRSPAAWVISMQARCVLDMMQRGLWLYVPKSTSRPPRALLTWNPSPQAGDTIRWGVNGHSKEGYVFAVVKETAYVSTYGGSCFVPLEISTVVKSIL